MSAHDSAETRAVKLRDIPLVKRLAENGAILDCELYFTQNSSSASLFKLLVPHGGVHTLLARVERQTVVGQFRLKADTHCAQIAYIAPGLQPDDPDDTPWLHLLDALAVEAGRRGVHLLAAEVDENSPLFKTLRSASYSIYARQEIWRCTPDGRSADSGDLALQEATEADLPEIQMLYAGIVPRLVQQIAGYPVAPGGLVYRHAGRVAGYIAVTEGRAGAFLMPHLHPDVFGEAAAIMAAAAARSSRGGKQAVYVRVRRYQDWLDDALVELGFDLVAQQAVLVKHIAAGVRSAAFAPLPHSLETVHSPVQPPTSGIIDS